MAENLATATRLVREAAGQGADVVLVQELFEGLYFCQEERAEHFARARPLDAAHPTLNAMQDLARELGVVLPVSLFERANQAYYNSLVMVDADGSALGVYRKSHIPDGRAMRRNSISAPAIPASRSGRRGSAGSASASAGISGSPRRPAPWR